MSNELLNIIGTIVGTIVTMLLGDKAWKYWTSRNTNATLVEREKIALDDVLRRLKLAEDAAKAMETKLNEAESRRNEERLAFVKLEAQSRDKINQLELTISKLSVSVELLMASLRKAAEEDENLSSLISKIEEINPKGDSV